MTSEPQPLIILQRQSSGLILENHGLLWDVASGRCWKILRLPGPYAGMNIPWVTGISEAGKAALKSLGAVENIH
jgi:hypothetical protein